MSRGYGGSCGAVLVPFRSRVFHEIRDAISVALAFSQPPHIPLCYPLTASRDVMTRLRFIDPSTLANKNQGFLRIRSGLGESESLLILCKCFVLIVTAALGIKPHTVFENVIIEVSRTRFCRTWIFANTIEVIWQWVCAWRRCRIISAHSLGRLAAVASYDASCVDTNSYEEKSSSH